MVSTFLSFPPAKNATKRLSGDQNGNDAPLGSGQRPSLHPYSAAHPELRHAGPGGSDERETAPVG